MSPADHGEPNPPCARALLLVPITSSVDGWATVQSMTEAWVASIVGVVGFAVPTAAS